MILEGSALRLYPLEGEKDVHEYFDEGRAVNVEDWVSHSV
jgi:hypothetical protein